MNFVHLSELRKQTGHPSDSALNMFIRRINQVMGDDLIIKIGSRVDLDSFESVVKRYQAKKLLKRSAAAKAKPQGCCAKGKRGGRI